MFPTGSRLAVVGVTVYFGIRPMAAFSTPCVARDAVRLLDYPLMNVKMSAADKLNFEALKARLTAI